MSFYNIADICVKLNCEKITKRNAKKYLCNKNCVPEIIISTDRNEVATRAKKAGYQYDDAAYLIEGNEFYRKLLSYNGVYIHSSAIVVNESAYLFSAPCGTGKSTHTGKWLELFGDKAYILNDDKPAIRIIDDAIYAYGTPWSGKHDISVNKKVKLQGICFLTRDSENWIKSMDKHLAAMRIYHGSLRKLPLELLNKELDIINKIVDNIPIYEMGCTPTIEAAQMAYDVMSKGEVK